MSGYFFNVSPLSHNTASFHQSLKPVKVIDGPVGSGKTTACIFEILKIIHSTPPSKKDNVRRSRGAIIRATYTNLETTTIKSWMEVAGYWGEPKHISGSQGAKQLKITFPKDGSLLKDGTRVECEILFLALNDVNDIEKVKGAEFTFAWINEGSESNYEIYSWLVGRMRYPSDGSLADAHKEKCYRPVVIDANTNFGEGHFLYDLKQSADFYSDDSSKGVFYCHQPPAVFPIEDVSAQYIKKAEDAGYPVVVSLSGKKWVINLEADNLFNLPKDYYLNAASANKDENIRVMLMAEYRQFYRGQPVYPGYNPRIHAVPSKAVESSDIYVGIDFGLNCAAVFGERLPFGCWHVFYEMFFDSMSTQEFGRYLADYIIHNFSKKSVHIYGDPAGSQKSAHADRMTGFQILNEELIVAGVVARPAMPTNDFEIRVGALAMLMRDLDPTGNAKFTVDKQACPLFHAGLEGGYHYKETGGIKQARPEKNDFSHVVEAGQYMVVGAGEGRRLVYSRALASAKKVDKNRPSVVSSYRVSHRRV